jgi:hypothetical protein
MTDHTDTPDPLLAAADAADAAAAPPAPPAPGEPATGAPDASAADELYGALDLLRLAVTQLKPSLAPVWTDQALRRIADAAPPVMAKYGWTVGGFFATWGPEIALVAAAAPLALGTARVLRADAAKAPELPAPDPAPVRATAASDAAAHVRPPRAVESAPAPLVEDGIGPTPLRRAGR